MHKTIAAYYISSTGIATAKLLLYRVNYLNGVPVRNRVDQWIKVESWQVGIFSFNEYNIRCVIPKIQIQSQINGEKLS